MTADGFLCTGIPDSLHCSSTTKSVMIRKKKVVLIGVGPLGAPLAEHLVRGGVTDLTLIAHDILEVGNLVRHSLTMGELGGSKAEALRDRLNAVNPHARVQAIARTIPSDATTRDHIRGADIIIDATASDDVFAYLNSLDWIEPTQFVSISIGLQARRLYAFSARSKHFSLDEFHSPLPADRARLAQR